MAKRLYQGSGSAVRRVDGWNSIDINTYVMGFCVLAVSQAEAEGLAIRMLLERAPREDGYRDHSVRLDPIAKADVQAWLDAYDQPD